MERIQYARATHGEEEIEAVVQVLRSGSQGLRIGRNVKEMETRVAELSGKKYGVMVNSGSSGLYLAVELLGLPRGSEIITSPLTFSTDIAPIVRAGLVPVFVDVEIDTYQIDVNKIEEMITERTGAILVPNLVGNAPDWDRLREIADKHNLKLIEDNCDALGATLRGTPTGARADYSVTSFAMAHIITCMGNGGMICVDTEEDRDQALLLRRWGRRSEPNLFGGGSGRVFREDLDGVPYDNDFIFDTLSWNFEPSEAGAAYGVVQLNKLEQNYARRQKTWQAYTDAYAAFPNFFRVPKPLPDLYTAWLCYPVLVREDAPFSRADLQEAIEAEGIDTRTIWTGNAARHPFLNDVEFRQPAAGLPEADRVFTHGMSLGMSHGLSDEDVERVCGAITSFAAQW